VAKSYGTQGKSVLLKQPKLFENYKDLKILEIISSISKVE